MERRVFERIAGAAMLCAIYAVAYGLWQAVRVFTP